MNTLDGYQQAAYKFALPQARNTTYMTLGVANEAGEVAGKLKKLFRSDCDWDAAKLSIAAELGDCLWYIAGLATVLEIDLSEIAQGNIDKLCSRQERGELQGDGDNR